jgi:heme O synthase-like polyprenyltransferase
MTTPPVAAVPPADAGRASWSSYFPLAKPGITALICTVAVGGFVLADPRSIDLVRLALLVGTGAADSAGASTNWPSRATPSGPTARTQGRRDEG